MRLQESNAEVLSWCFCLSFLESFHQRLVLLVGRREVGQVQLPDLAARHAVELAQDFVADVGCMIGAGHYSAELELDDILDLLVGEFFHWQI